MRLIDADALLDKQECLFMKRHILFHGVTAYTIESSPTIDPETLPIVQELRKKLERVTKERDDLIWDMKVYGSGCYSCKYFDAPNGKCKAEEPCGVNNNWEWRGIQEAQDDE